MESDDEASIRMKFLNPILCRISSKFKLKVHTEYRENDKCDYVLKSSTENIICYVEAKKQINKDQIREIYGRLTET